MKPAVVALALTVNPTTPGVTLGSRDSQYAVFEVARFLGFRAKGIAIYTAQPISAISRSFLHPMKRKIQITLACRSELVKVWLVPQQLGN